MRRFWVRVEGQSLVLFALFLTVLLGMVALAIDVGYLYFARTSFQKAAEAGCLGGGSGLTISQGEATSRAVEYAGYNLTGSLAGAATTVTFPASDTLRVQVSHPALPLFSAGVLGWPTAPVSARAACQGQPAASTAELVPLAFYCNNPNGCLGVFNPATYPITLSAQRYCGNFFLGGANGSACGNTIADGEVFVGGITFTQNSNSNAVFREEVYSGYPGTLSIGDMVGALPGNRNGWRDGMYNRVARPGGNEMILPVVAPCEAGCSIRYDVHPDRRPAEDSLTMQIIGFLKLKGNFFGPSKKTDHMTFEIIPGVTSSTITPDDLGVNSVFGVRLIE